MSGWRMAWPVCLSKKWNLLLSTARSTLRPTRAEVLGLTRAVYMQCSAGAVQVRQPRVNDKRVDPVTGERKRFASSILPAWSRKSPKVSEVLPLLYLHGLSTSDFAPALEQFLRSR
jgi:hypothetical protein